MEDDINRYGEEGDEERYENDERSGYSRAKEENKTHGDGFLKQDRSVVGESYDKGSSYNDRSDMDDSCTNGP